MSAESSKLEQPVHGNSGNSTHKFLDEILQNRAVDVGLGVAASVVAGIAIMTGKERIVSACESLFPKAADVLESTSELAKIGSTGKIDSGFEMAKGALAETSSRVDQNLLSRKLDELRPLSWTAASPAVLDKLAEHDDAQLLEHVAGNRAATAKTLLKLVNNKNINGTTEQLIAEHPNASPLVLAKLAQLQPDAVSAHAATSGETLEQLSILDDFRIHRNIAQHLNANPQTLDSLSHAADTWTVANVGMNPNTSLKTLQNLPYDSLKTHLGSSYLSSANFHKLVESETTPDSVFRSIEQRQWAVKGMTQDQVKRAIAARN
jgi:hypothetical protein